MTTGKEIEKRPEPETTEVTRPLTPAEARVQAIALQGDIERMKLFGKALDIVGTVVKSQAQIKVIREQRQLIAEQIDGKLKEARIQLETAQKGHDNVREALSRQRQVIHEDIPAFLQMFPEMNAEQKKDIIINLLQKLPEVSVKA